MKRYPFAQALVIVLFAGCTAAPSPSATQPGPSATASVATSPPSAAPTPVPIGPGSGSSIQEALAFVPPGAPGVSFTDWAQLKAEAGYPNVTSSSPKDEHDALLAAIHAPLGPPTAHPPSVGSELVIHLPYLAAQWGFDATDVAWEMATEADSARLIVLRFPDAFDLQPLVDLLVERAYTVDEVNGARVYRHDETPDQWLISAPVFQNVALLEDGRTIMLAFRRPVSGGMGAIVESILDPSAASVERAQFTAVAAALDHPTGATLWLGDALCQVITGAAPAFNDQVKEEIVAAQPLGRYVALGIGYSDAHDPVGRMVFAYGTSEAAAADVAGRRQLAERGHVTWRNPPVTFADRWFSVVEARADGTNLLFELQPVNGTPAGMMALGSLEMTYATCGNPFDSSL